MIDSGNYERIRTLIQEDPKSFTPVPVQYVIELMRDTGINTMMEEGATDSIEKVTYRPGAAGSVVFVLEGPRCINGFEWDDIVLVSRR